MISYRRPLAVLPYSNVLAPTGLIHPGALVCEEMQLALSFDLKVSQKYPNSKLERLAFDHNTS
jgi:hypothetical protein